VATTVAIARPAVGSELTVVSLERNNLRPPAVAGIANLLQSHPTVRVLDLSGNHLGDDGAAALVDALSAAPPPSLTTLNLSANDLTPAGAAAVAQGCILRGRSVVPSLRTLILSHNGLGDAGCGAVVKSIVECAMSVLEGGDTESDIGDVLRLRQLGVVGVGASAAGHASLDEAMATLSAVGVSMRIAHRDGDVLEVDDGGVDDASVHQEGSGAPRVGVDSLPVVPEEGDDGSAREDIHTGRSHEGGAGMTESVHVPLTRTESAATNVGMEADAETGDGHDAPPDLREGTEGGEPAVSSLAPAQASGDGSGLDGGEAVDVSATLVAAVATGSSASGGDGNVVDLFHRYVASQVEAAVAERTATLEALVMQMQQQLAGIQTTGTGRPLDTNMEPAAEASPSSAAEHAMAVVGSPPVDTAVLGSVHNAAHPATPTMAPGSMATDHRPVAAPYSRAGYAFKLPVAAPAAVGDHGRSSSPATAPSGHRTVSPGRAAPHVAVSVPAAGPDYAKLIAQRAQQARQAHAQLAAAPASPPPPPAATAAAVGRHVPPAAPTHPRGAAGAASRAASPAASSKLDAMRGSLTVSPKEMVTAASSSNLWASGLRGSGAGAPPMSVSQRAPSPSKAAPPGTVVGSSGSPARMRPPAASRPPRPAPSPSPAPAPASNPVSAAAAAGAAAARAASPPKTSARQHPPTSGRTQRGAPTSRTITSTLRGDADVGSVDGDVLTVNSDNLDDDMLLSTDAAPWRVRKPPPPSAGAPVGLAATHAQATAAPKPPLPPPPPPPPPSRLPAWLLPAGSNQVLHQRSVRVVPCA